MNITILDDEKMEQFANYIVTRLQQTLTNKKKWLKPEEAMKALNITSKSTLKNTVMKEKFDIPNIAVKSFYTILNPLTNY